MNDPVFVPDGGRDMEEEVCFVEFMLHLTSEQTGERLDMDEEVVVFGRGP